MTEFRLTPRPALGGLHQTVGTTSLREIAGAGLTVISIPMGEEAAMQVAAKAHFGCALPEVGASALSTETGARVLRVARDRVMILQMPGAGGDRLPDLPGYRVDQSDYWVLVDLAGPLSVPSLERTCRLDLDAAAFSPGTFARTPIEGVSTILLRLEIDRFLLMAPRSYARSLVHTLTTSLHYVAP